MYKQNIITLSKNLDDNQSSKMALSDFLYRNREITDKGVTFHLLTDELVVYSYKDLYKRALQMLSYLSSNGVQPGNNLILALDNKENFILTFWACILGGIRSIPANSNMANIKSYMSFFVQNTPTYCITSKVDFDVLQSCCKWQSSVSGIVYPNRSDLDLYPINTQLLYDWDYDEIAMFMFSSGSVSAPKCVAVTNKMIHNYVINLQGSMCYDDQDIYLGFLPLNHNTALIPYHIYPMYIGAQQYLSDVRYMFMDDHSLMDLATRFKATVSGTISTQMLKYAKRAEQCDNLPWELSRMHTFFVGAEPINVDIYDFFTTHMKKYGMRKTAVKAAYGLTETTSLITFQQQENADSIVVDQRFLAIGDVVQIIDKADHNARCFMSVGEPIQGVEIHIENDNGDILDDMMVGIIKIKGNSVIQSYYNTVGQGWSGEWFDTGDIGTIKDSQVYILGRKKDMFIINGKNYFCNDLEEEMTLKFGLNTDALAFAVLTDPSKVEFDSLICFINSSQVIEERSKLMDKIYHYCIDRYAIGIETFVFIPEFLKTSSGKVRRHIMKQNYLDGKMTGIETIKYGQKRIGAVELKDIQDIVGKIISEHVSKDINQNDSLLTYIQDSSSLAKIHLQIEEHYMGALTVVDLITCPTIRQLSDLIFRHYQ